MKKFIIASAVLAVAGMGCDNKVEQCNSFVEAANKAESSFVALNAAALNPKSLEGRADQVKEANGGVKAVELKDPKLTELRDKYSTGLEGYEKGLRDLSKLDKENVDEFNKIVDELNKVGESQDKTIDDLNAYCQGTE